MWNLFSLSIFRLLSSSMNATKTAAFLSTTMKKAQQVMKTILKTGLNTVKRSRREADEKMLTYNITNWIETQKLKWRQALRIATQSQDLRTRKAAERNPGLVISTKTRRKVRRPAKRWEDDLNGFVKNEATEATQSNDLQNDTAWLAAAINADDWKKRERQCVKLPIND